jgi:hypothetical protein
MVCQHLRKNSVTIHFDAVSSIRTVCGIRVVPARSKNVNCGEFIGLFGTSVCRLLVLKVN